MNFFKTKNRKIIKSLFFIPLGICLAASGCRAVPQPAAEAPVAQTETSIAAPSTKFREETSKYWNFTELEKVPAYKPAGFADSESEGLQSILYDGVAANKSVRSVFAYIGYPKTPPPAGGYPGVVMIHGGEGTAYPEYAKLFNSYGYAVIALDWYNQRPVITDPGEGAKSKIGRAALPGGYTKPNNDAQHIAVVSNIVLANSLLRSLPNVNKDKIGFVGASWGSWYGGILTTLDPRFKCGIEIYCGDYFPQRYLVDIRNRMVDGRFFHAATVPTYWIAGATDRNVTPESLQRGWDESPTIVNKTLVAVLPHSAEDGFRFKAVKRMTDYFLQGGIGVKKATLSYTTDRIGEEPSPQPYLLETYKRVWKTVPATISGNKVSATLPPDTSQCFLSVYDEITATNDCSGSSTLSSLNRLFPALATRTDQRNLAFSVDGKLGAVLSILESSNPATASVVGGWGDYCSASQSKATVPSLK